MWSKLAAGEQNNFITMAKVNYKKYYGMYIISQTIQHSQSNGVTLFITGAFEGDVIIEEILQIELDQNDAIIKESQFDLDATLINLSVSDDN